MRARVRVGEIRRRRTGATFSGLIENSVPSNGIVERRKALSGLQFEKLVRVDSESVGVDRGRCGDRSGDDLALGAQTGDARVDQAGAELVEEQDAGDENDQRGEIENDDAAREAGEDVDGGKNRKCAEDAAENAGAPPGIFGVGHRAFVNSGCHRCLSEPNLSGQSSLKR